MKKIILLGLIVIGYTYPDLRVQLPKVPERIHGVLFGDKGNQLALPKTLPEGLDLSKQSGHTLDEKLVHELSGRDLKKIRTLDLSEQPIKDFTMKGLAKVLKKMTGLQLLILNEVPLTSFKGMPILSNLEIISLWGTPLNSLGSMPTFPNLKRLYLDNNLQKLSTERIRQYKDRYTNRTNKRGIQVPLDVFREATLKQTETQIFASGESLT